MHHQFKLDDMHGEFSGFHFTSVFSWWSFKLLCHVVFWLYTNVLEEHTASALNMEAV
jgi:hypothetical protein